MSRREQSPPEFFIDRSLGRKHMAEALRALGFVAHTLSSVYGEKKGQGTDDEQWLCGRRSPRLDRPDEGRFVGNIHRILRQSRRPGPYIYGVYEGHLKRLWPPE